MSVIFKTVFYYLTFFIFSLNLVNGAAESSDGEAVLEKRLPKEAYTLSPLHEIKLTEEEISRGIRPFIEEGFSEKRAKEIFARERMKEFFLETYAMTDFTGLARKDLGERFTTSYTKGTTGFVDNLFIEYVTDLKTLCEEQDPAQYQAYLDTYRTVKAAFNEVYFLKAGEEISPLLVTQELLEKRNVYSIVWPTLTKWGALKIENSCITAQVSSIPLSWISTFWRFKSLMETRLAESTYGHTLTILRPDGSLILYDVVKE